MIIFCHFSANVWCRGRLMKEASISAFTSGTRVTLPYDCRLSMSENGRNVTEALATKLGLDTGTIVEVADARGPDTRTFEVKS